MNAQHVAGALSCGRPGCGCGKRHGGGWWRTHCTCHADDDPSLDLKDGERGGLVINDFGGCKAADVREELRRRKMITDNNRAAKRANSRQIRYEIRDTDGSLQAVHVREEVGGKKRLTWERPEGTSGLGGVPVTDLPLFGVERLKSLPDRATVVVVEGEKAANALLSRGIPAVGTVTGAALIPGDGALRPLLRFGVTLWPDADVAGRQHMEKIALALCRLGHCDSQIVEWPDAPKKGDAADYTGSVEDLKALLDAAPSVDSRPTIDLAGLLEEVKATIKMYVVVTDPQAVALALWTAHTHAIEAADVTPYINVNSPEKRSGKTRLMEVLKRLVARPWMTARTTPAALYRRLDAEGSTLLLDESDAAFKAADEYSETLRGVLNSGFERGGSVTVCIGQGKDLGYREFQTFGAKAIAGIGKLPDTVADRSISIAMKRQAPGEKAEKLRRRQVQVRTEPLRNRLAEWALTAVAMLGTAEPQIPSELDDRASDGWEPLLAIADAAGGSWPQTARAAALALSVGDGREDDSLNVRLLADIRRTFERRGVGRLAIADLVASLVAIEESPWADLRGKPLDSRSLGWRLKPYGIKAKSIRVDSGDVARGYHVEWFHDAWTRYLPEKPSQTDTTDTSDTNDVTVVTDVTVSPDMIAMPNETCLDCDTEAVKYGDGKAWCEWHGPGTMAAS